MYSPVKNRDVQSQPKNPKKTEHTKGLSFGSSAIFSSTRPAAFRPPLTKGLALSGGQPLSEIFSKKIKLFKLSEMKML